MDSAASRRVLWSSLRCEEPPHLSPTASRGAGTEGGRFTVLALMIGFVQVLCAGCGCTVDSGVRVAVCGNENCCCRELPTREPDPEAIAESEN